MKFESKEAEEYFYEKTKDYGDVRVNSDDNMIWTIDKIDNFISDLKKIDDFEKSIKYYHNSIKKPFLLQ